MAARKKSPTGLCNHKSLCGIAVAAFWFIVWAVVSRAVGTAFILPSPMETGRALIELAQQAYFWQAVGASLGRILLGYGLAVLAGGVLGALTAASSLLDALLRPIRGIMKATPVTSFILLLILWMRSTVTPMFTAFLMVTPVVWANVQEGILATDERLLEMAEVFRFGPIKTAALVYLPSILPALLAAAATGLGLAWKAGVAAEILAYAKPSIGYGMWENKVGLNTPGVFAWTVVIIALSMLLERLVVAGIKRTKVLRKEGV